MHCVKPRSSCFGILIGGGRPEPLAFRPPALLLLLLLILLLLLLLLLLDPSSGLGSEGELRPGVVGTASGDERRSSEEGSGDDAFPTRI